MTHHTYRGVLALAGLALFLASPLAAQESAAEREAFFDQVHAPNWLGTDIAHTSIKAQRGGTCWSFATVSFLESEVLRQNPELAAALAAEGQPLDISEYYVVYWAWVAKTREYVTRHGQGFHPRRGEVPLGDGGLPHDVLRIVRDHGLVPDAAYPEPEDSRQMTREILSAMARADGTGWDVEGTVAAVREVLDRHLAPPPTEVEVDGRTMAPREYATDYLGIDPDSFVELMSYTSAPWYGYGEVDVPDNWWDYDRYVNLPLDVFVGVINRALDNGYSVAFDTDWGDPGAEWNRAGLGVILPDEAPGGINQAQRQTDFEEQRTTDDHLVHAVDHRVLDGRDWYLIKNSHGTGTGRRGYVWMRGDWLKLRVLNVMLNREAVDADLMGRIN